MRIRRLDWLLSCRPICPALPLDAEVISIPRHAVLRGSARVVHRLHSLLSIGAFATALPLAAKVNPIPRHAVLGGSAIDLTHYP